MSARVVPIATNTFREAVRDRVLYNLVAFAILMAGAALLVGQIFINKERLPVFKPCFGAVLPVCRGLSPLLRPCPVSPGNKTSKRLTPGSPPPRRPGIIP